jgi:hypothetical protein
MKQPDFSLAKTMLVLRVNSRSSDLMYLICLNFSDTGFIIYQPTLLIKIIFS